MHRNKRCAWVSLFDHLVGEREDLWRNFEPQSPRGLEVDDELELGDLLDGQIDGLLALENPAGVDACLAVRLRNAAAIAHQAAGDGEVARLKDRRGRVAEGQVDKPFTPADEERVGTDHEPTST